MHSGPESGPHSLRCKNPRKDRADLGHCIPVQLVRVRNKVGLHSDTALLAMSFSNDAEAKTIANGIGAAAFLDKVNLTEELIPTILRLAEPRQNAVIWSDDAI